MTEENKPTVLLEDQDWYQELITECSAILVEKGYNARIEIIEGKWLLGDRIIAEEGNFKKFGYGDKIVEKLSKQLDISESHLWKILQFRRKYEAWDDVLSKLPHGKAISWHHVCQELLPSAERKVEPTDCHHTFVRCEKCNKRLRYDKNH